MVHQRTVQRRAIVKLVVVLGALSMLAAACGGSDSAGGATRTASAGKNANKVKIGINEALSGDLAAFSIPAADGVRLAVNEINQAGGFKVDGTTYDFDLTEFDNTSDPSQAVAGHQKLVTDDGIKLIFGPTVGALAQQAQPIAVQGKALNISAASTWQAGGDLSDPNKPLLFSSQVSATSRGEVVAAGIDELGAHKVGFIAVDDDTAKGILPSFEAAVKDKGMSVEQVLYPPDTTDLTPFLTRLKAKGIDVLFIGFPQTRANETLRLAQELNVAPKGFAVYGIDPATATGGKKIPVPVILADGVPSLAEPANKKVAKLKAGLAKLDPKMPQQTAQYVFYAYDEVYMLVEAMKKAGTVEDTTAIAKALEGLTYKGAAGTICWESNARIVKNDTSQLFIRDGKLESKEFPSGC